MIHYLSLLKKVFLGSALLFLASCDNKPASNNPATEHTVQPSIATLRQKIDSVIHIRKAEIGVAVLGLEDRDTLSINGDQHFTMLSVVKFPQALAVLHQVDLGRASLSQPIYFNKSDLRQESYSPLTKERPEGNFDITLEQSLLYSVGRSDNNVCDKLFKVFGSPKSVEDYIHQLGFNGIGIGTDYASMHTNGMQANWCTPKTAVQLLEGFYRGNILKDSTRNALWKCMAGSLSPEDRIKGLLPPGTIVAHKTGTSGTDSNGVTAAFNDIGIVTLPNNKHFAIAVFINNSKETNEVNARTIAEITKAVRDYYTKWE